MNWLEKRAEFQNRFDKLNQTQVDPVLTELNQAMGTFVARGGLSMNPKENPQYNDIEEKINQVETLKAEYSSLQRDILNFLRVATDENDLTGKLSENGDLQKNIQQLEKLEKEMKVDVDSAIARDELLRTRNANITRHQLYIMNRPIRRGMIPFLWILSILFIGVGLLILRETAPSFPMKNGLGNAGTNMGTLLYDLIGNTMVLGTLLVSALIVILFLSLKVGGVLH
jgi:hypothetical protein